MAYEFEGESACTTGLQYPAPGEQGGGEFGAAPGERRGWADIAVIQIDSFRHQTVGIGVVEHPVDERFGGGFVAVQRLILGCGGGGKEKDRVTILGQACIRGVEILHAT